jgi:hypothetical protein
MLSLRNHPGTPYCAFLLQTALALACRHLTDPKTICKALCTSKSLTAAILDACSGSGNSNIIIKLGPCSVDQITQQALWLEQFGGMVAKLVLCLNFQNVQQISRGAASCERIACLALHRLQLKELVLQDCMQPVAVLRATDGATLRHLGISVSKQVPVTKLSSPLLAGALGRLTGIHSLRINAVDQSGTMNLTGNKIALSNDTCAALASFTQLTRLELGNTLLPADCCQQLPTQLRSLSLWGLATSRDIRHLQLLTSLTLSSPKHSAFVGLQRLRSLQELNVTGSSAVLGPGPGRVLCVTDTFDSLRCLESQDSKAISQELAALVAASTGLTRLLLLHYGADVLASSVCIHAMMQPLQQVRELVLILPHYKARAPPAAAGLLPAGLTALTHLRLHLEEMPETVRMQLYHHTQLKGLTLGNAAGLSGDEVLQALAVCLPELEALNLNMFVSAAAATGVLNSFSLPRLQSLALMRGNLTAPEQDQVKAIRPGLRLDYCAS